MENNYIDETNDPKKFLYNIRLIEREYEGKYVDTIDFNPIMSIQLKFLGIDLGTKKLVMLKTKMPIVIKCKRCGFSIKKKHLLAEGGTLKCRSCHKIYYETDWKFRGGKYVRV